MRFCAPKLRVPESPRMPIEGDFVAAGGPWRQGPPFGVAARVRPVPPLPPAENLATHRADPARSVALGGILVASEGLAHGRPPWRRPPHDQAALPVGASNPKGPNEEPVRPGVGCPAGESVRAGKPRPHGWAGGSRRARRPRWGVRPASCSAGRLRDPSRRWPARGERRGPTHRDWTAGPHSGRTGDNLRRSVNDGPPAQELAREWLQGSTGRRRPQRARTQAGTGHSGMSPVCCRRSTHGTTGKA